MAVPAAMRKRLLEIERAGFKVLSCEPRRGSHFTVIFEGIEAPQIMSSHQGCPRATKNLVAHLKRLKR